MNKIAFILSRLLPGFLLAVTPIVAIPLASNAQVQKKTAYLFTYFTGNEATEEAIHFAISKDGFNFRALNKDQPVLSAAQISSTGGVRDPHILRAADEKTFYMVATDMQVAKFGWGPNTAMVLMKSKDLIYWTSHVVDIAKLFKPFASVNRVWAPQTIYDRKSKKYMLYWSMRIGEGADVIYYAYANKDFSGLESEPKQLFFHPEGKSCIDGDIVYKDGKYNLFFKTEGSGNGIKKAVSAKLTGGYVLVDKYLQQTTDPVEGAGVFKLNEGPDYILMYDVYTKGRYQFTRSSDLNNFKAIDNEVSMNFHPRHGTVIPITTLESEALLRKWSSADEVMLSAYSNALKLRNVVLDTAASTLYLPVKNGVNLKDLNPGFMSAPGIKITPEKPFDLSKGTTGLNVSFLGKTKRYQVTASEDHNPVLDGFYADPEVLYSNKTNKYYLYPTSDGFTNWSGTYFKTFSSTDLINWKDEGVILDLKRDVTWGKRNAWAPTIAEKKINGAYKYFYYFCAAQKVGVAVADDPAGPFTDSGKPLISRHPTGVKDGQEIDADVFTDPASNKSYLYWGNGYLAVAPLNEDMISIDSTAIKVITPTDKTFREGTEVFFRKGKYYFMWSEEDTRSENYRVRYGYSDSPMGPITIPPNNLILAKDVAKGIYGTGHNAVIQVPGKDEWYIVYHRFNRPKGITMGDAAGYNREVCIDKMEFNADGSIKKVLPTLKGIDKL
jgi:arabinoxylan arabinofuranohydrolase